MRNLKRALFAVILTLASSTLSAGLHPRGGPSTTNNNDSCDIALLPAATLLLPYFDVDVTRPNGRTATFTITNVSHLEQIAHVTLWTSRAYPVINFNVYLTGYDVQTIDLRDVFKGRIAPPNGAGLEDAHTGPLSEFNRQLDTSTCLNAPSQLTPALVRRMELAFLQGKVEATPSSPACSEVADQPPVFGHAIGYVTIDVVGSCTSLSPADSAYYTDAIRYDNVLAGEYQQLEENGATAEGGPLVHIRAIRGHDGTTKLTNTFYARFQPPQSPHRDARQPLPSRFAARFVDTGYAGTSMKIWRQGRTAADVPCNSYKCNAKLQIVEFVTFDDQENAVGAAPDQGPVCTPIELEFITSATVRAEVGSGFFPAIYEDATSGWIYMNLSSDESANEPPRQAWVISSMELHGLYSADADVVALGNGCSPVIPPSEIDSRGSGAVGPLANVNP
jgi:hypothetical protein